MSTIEKPKTMFTTKLTALDYFARDFELKISKEKRNFTLSRAAMQSYGLLLFNKRCNLEKGSKCFRFKGLRVLFQIIWN